MLKDTSISIRMDSGLKEQTENVLDQFGLNMTTVINMLFHQIVTEQAVPLSLSLRSKGYIAEGLELAKADRVAGYVGRPADSVASDIERIIAEAERGTIKI